MGERQTKWGKNIREARAHAGLTQGELAERVGVAQSAISRWELGQGEIPDDQKIAIARALDADPDEMFSLGGF